MLDLTVRRVFRALLQLYGEAVLFLFGLFLTSLSKVFSCPFPNLQLFSRVSGDLSSSSVAFPFDKVSFCFLSLCLESSLFQVDSVKARGLGGVLVCFGRIVLLCLFFHRWALS